MIKPQSSDKNTNSNRSKRQGFVDMHALCGLCSPKHFSLVSRVVVISLCSNILGKAIIGKHVVLRWSRVYFH